MDSIPATRNGALALGIGSKTGTIEVGKIADLVVLGKNPLEDIGNVKSVYLVVKAGKIHKRD
jgi:imidazolonepropionase-like amidohydrolase